MPHRLRLVAAFICGCALVLAACGTASTTTGGSSSGNTTGSGTGPSSVPTITTTFCQNIMTADQANQILQIASSDDPLSQATADGQFCSYQTAGTTSSPGRSVLSINFLAYDSKHESFSGVIQFAVATAKSNGATVMTQSVSGLGDQAEYVSAAGSDAKTDNLYVLKGSVVFIISVSDDTNIGAPSDATAESEFQQIAQRVLAHL